MRTEQPLSSSGGQKVVVVEERRNPSTDFFVAPYVTAWSGTAPQLFRLASPPDGAPEPGTWLVFTRYVNARWRRWVGRYRDRLGRISLFMDDDLFDSLAWAGLPWFYRSRLWYLAGRHRDWLARMGADLLVSTEYLADKYDDWSPVTLKPSSPYKACARFDAGSSRVFYHGSSTHRSEHRWLRPVIEAVLDAVPEASYEVIADWWVARLYAGMPRVKVVPPMSWPEYRAFITRPGRAVGLAPLLHSPFNAARAPTKVFDIAAAGAAGLYADDAVYREAVRDGGNGRLLPMQPDVWTEAIVSLLRAPQEREALWRGQSSS